MKYEFKKIKTLTVHLENRQVGVISRLAGNKHIFSFEQDYVNDPDRPTLSLAFKGILETISTYVRPVRRRLPAFFSNLLPEGHLRTYLAGQIGVKEEREFFLLAALGADLPGGVTVKPLVASASPDSGQVREKEILYPEDKQFLRFSLAGVQLKFSAIMEAAGGLTIPADGMGGSWIIKLPSTRFSAVPENEFTMMNLARRVGIEVPEVSLIPVKEVQGLPKEASSMEGNALAIKRFDRGPNNQRIHMEDFAQVFGIFPDSKYKNRSYANIASVLWAETNEESTHEFIRRVVFSITIGNADMHLKNWSLIYRDGRRPTLSPAYDFLSTVAYISDDSLGLTFGGNRSLKAISKNQVRRFADSARLPVTPIWDIVNETRDKTIESWSSLEHKETLPVSIQNAITEQIMTVTLNKN